MSPNPLYDELKEQYFGTQELCKSPDFTLYDDGESIVLIDRENPITDPALSPQAPSQPKRKLFGRNQGSLGTV